jgi:sensor histidine kinase YesM
MHRLILIAIIFAWCKSPDLKPQPVQDKVDSMILFIKKEVNAHLHDQQPALAGKILDSLKPTVDTINHYRLTCAWLRAKTAEKTAGENLDSARYFGHKALELSLQYDTGQRDILASKAQLADVLNELTLYDSALLFAHEAYYLAKKIDTPGLPVICLRLSEIYSKIKDYPMRRHYLYEGLKYSTQPRHRIVLTNNISSYYSEMGLYDSAYAFLKQIENDSTFSSPYYNAIKYENMGVSLSNLNRHKEGLQYQLKAAGISKQIGKMDGQSYYNLAATYRHLKEYEKSILHLDTALQLTRSTPNYNLTKRIYHALATTYQLQHNYKAATATLDSAFTYYAIEVDSSIILKARELETQYRVKAKDDQINDLAYTNEVNRRINRQQQLTLIAVITAAILLIIVGILLWRRSQLKALVREYELRQQLLQISMDRHFILNSFGNMLSFVRSSLNEKAITYGTHFAILMRKALDNVGYSYVSLQDEIETLESYLQLQEMNYEGLFGYKIEAYNGYKEDQITIPPMLLQPFVENAIIHGFRSMKEKGFIHVLIERDSHTLHITIDDNGIGLQDKPTNAVKRSLAKVITQQRLRILSRKSGKRASLSIIDKHTTQMENGVQVKLIIPFRQTKAIT